MTIDRDWILTYIGETFKQLTVKALEARIGGRITDEEYDKVTDKMLEILEYLEKNLK